MLQRAASNAYSWWWASHIRTKQSKWLDNDLEEMEGRIKSMLKIIEEDGDSFAKKAEIYFKKRPELTHFVEETYRAYRALAERYDHISGELHKANHTIATAFPDQVQFDMQDDEDDNFPKAITSIDSSKLHKPSADISKFSSVNKRRESQAALKKSRLARVASHSSTEKAQEEIDRLQKAILVLQTEKEFIKSSYESGIAKYWEIEKQIAEMQDEVFLLQDEFSASVDIEDDEARALMASAAIKSCEHTLNNLQLQQKRSMEEAVTESGKIKTAKEKMKTIKGDYTESEEIAETSDDRRGVRSTAINIEEVSSPKQENIELQSICDKVQEHFEISTDTSVVELAEKINELVMKVINFEGIASSQTAQLKSLRSETDALQKHLQSFEEERKTLIDDSNHLRDRLKQAEEDLIRTKDLDEHAQDEKSIKDSNSMEACCRLSDISEKMLSSKHRDEFNIAGPTEEEIISSIEPQSDHEEKEVKLILATQDNLIEEESLGIQEPGLHHKDQKAFAHSEAVSWLETDSTKFQGPDQEVEKKSSQANDRNDLRNELGAQLENDAIKFLDPKQKVDITSSQADKNIHPSKEIVAKLEEDSVKFQNLSQEIEVKSQEADGNSQQSMEKGAQLGEQEISLDWLQSLVNGLEGKEKILLAEYTSILRNYKEAKKRLSESEKKNEEYLSEMAAQIRELNSAIVMKDEEIQSLQKNLKSIQLNCNENLPTFEGLHNQKYKSKHSFSASLVESPNLQAPSILEDLNLEVRAKKNSQSEIADGPQTISAIEEKFRRDIDTLLEENLEFWLRFSTSFQHIQKFQTAFEELQAEIENLKDSKAEEGSSHSGADKSVNSESTPMEKQLRELKTELQVWLEQNVLLQGELQSKISSISSIQEDISGALEASLAAEGAHFTPYQAAKFQGEVLNIQLENNKVADEMHAGLDLVNGLQGEVEKALSRLHEKLELSGPKSSHHHHFRHISTKTRVPLRSFLFGAKPKKKQSIFACVSPAFQKQHSDLPYGHPT